MSEPANPQELFEFPCDHVFKVIGPSSTDFTEAVYSAVARVVPVSRDAVRVRASQGKKYVSVSVVVRVHSYPQVTAIYTELKGLPDLRYLL